MIITLLSIYDESEDAEVYGLALALTAYSGEATTVLLSAVLDLLAKLNYFMQRKTIDFSQLPIFLDGILAEQNHLKDDIAEWCSLVLAELTDVRDISLQERSIRNPGPNNITDYRPCIAIPYIEELVSHINNHFSEASVQLLTSSAIFHPAPIPKEEPDILEHGRTEMQTLVAFCGKQALWNLRE